MKLPIARLEGTPRERGTTHGELFADEIRNNIEFYLDHFAENGVDNQTAREHARKFIDFLGEGHEEYVSEMRGVAEGSGVSLEDITLINVRHTILYSAYPDKRQTEAVEEPSVDGCTSFGLRPEVTANGHTYVGQNWDWESPIESFVMDVHQQDRPDFLAVTEAGMVGGKFGLNEHGFGLVVNGLSTPSDGKDPYRKPAHVRDREILNADRFDRALEPIIGEERPTSRNYVVAHEIGEMVDVETTPDSFNYLYPDDGILTHANHFEDRSNVQSKLETQIPHTVARGMRIDRLLKQIETDIDEEDMKNVLRDHFGKPASICRHTQPDADENALSHTNVSVIMDLNERRMLVTNGPPCENEYHEYRVAGS